MAVPDLYVRGKLLNRESTPMNANDSRFTATPARLVWPPNCQAGSLIRLPVFRGVLSNIAQMDWCVGSAAINDG
jgi:hypothetical protein